jgi:DNA modification methylase
MDLFRLEAIKNELGADRLKIMCTGELEVDWRVLRELQTMSDGRSLKKTDDGKILRLAESLLRFGMVNNLQIWSDGDGEIYCFDAHHRRRAFAILDEIGLDIPALPATRCLAEDDTAARKLLIIKESRSSWIDVNVVPDYMREIGFDFEIASAVIDFPEFEWGDIADEYEEQREKNEKSDVVPEVLDDTRIKLGDLIELGRHRVLCGDSTRAEDVEMLLSGEKANMVFTDPPYGIGEAAGKNKSRDHRGIKAHDFGNKAWDDNIPPKIAFELMFKWSDNQMIFGGNYFVEYLKNSPCWLVWNKNNSGDFADCELVWTSLSSAVRLYKYRWNGMLQEDMKNKEQRFHPTQKPVGLFEKIFADYQFKTCLDPFLGSGSTLIACEKTGRRCFGIEIDPHYCSVVVQRWVDFTGNDLVKINGMEVAWNEYKK